MPLQVAYLANSTPAVLSIHSLITSSLGIYPLLTIIMTKYGEAPSSPFAA